MNNRTLIILGLVGLSLVAFAPTIGALPLGCSAPDGVGDNSVVVLPSGENTNWTSDCVHVANGSVVRFQNLDPLSGHGATRAGCFSLGTMDVSGSQSLKLTYSAEDGILYTEENGAFGACEGVTAGASTIELVYDCAVHGDLMTARILIDL
ncbi:MAG TPA: hypothetical protein VM370_01890 [Candidatus Thermoplasmatota archaeon]|nr:hypothetical protein [Candidatus Thermoplasmatota archaeon]